MRQQRRGVASGAAQLKAGLARQYHAGRDQAHARAKIDAATLRLTRAGRPFMLGACLRACVSRTIRGPAAATTRLTICRATDAPRRAFGAASSPSLSRGRARSRLASAEDGSAARRTKRGGCAKKPARASRPAAVFPRGRRTRSTPRWQNASRPAVATTSSSRPSNAVGRAREGRTRAPPRNSPGRGDAGSCTDGTLSWIGAGHRPRRERR